MKAAKYASFTFTYRQAGNWIPALKTQSTKDLSALFPVSPCPVAFFLEIPPTLCENNIALNEIFSRKVTYLIKAHC
jgi:hypothetical protein